MPAPVYGEPIAAPPPAPALVACSAADPWWQKGLRVPPDDPRADWLNPTLITYDLFQGLLDAGLPIYRSEHSTLGTRLAREVDFEIAPQIFGECAWRKLPYLNGILFGLWAVFKARWIGFPYAIRLARMEFLGGVKV